MENVSEVNEDITFNALKYRRYASIDIVISGQFIPAKATYWINDAGQFHRENGPAIEYADGSKIWCLNGKLHREDGPAFERADGAKYWYRNGKLHREDGPAIECANGTKSWWVNGKRIRSE